MQSNHNLDHGPARLCRSLGGLGSLPAGTILCLDKHAKTKVKVSIRNIARIRGALNAGTLTSKEYTSCNALFPLYEIWGLYATLLVILLTLKQSLAAQIGDHNYVSTSGEDVGADTFFSLFSDCRWNNQECGKALIARRVAMPL